MERHIRWRMFLVMFIVSASPSFCPSTTMLQCLHLNFPFHVLSDFWTVMVTPMLCFVFLTAASTQHNCIFFPTYNIGLNDIHPCESISKRFFEEWCGWNGVTFVFWWRPGSLQSFYFHHLAEGKQEGDDCQDHSEISCHPQNILDGTEDWGELMLLGELRK